MSTVHNGWDEPRIIDGEDEWYEQDKPSGMDGFQLLEKQWNNKCNYHW